jgi:transposase InsO family protein
MTLQLGPRYNERASSLPKEAVRKNWRRLAHTRRIRLLERELERTRKRLVETEALLQLKRLSTAAGRRGQWRSPAERRRILRQVTALLQAGVRLKQLGSLLGVSTRTIQRWRASGTAEDRRQQGRAPVNRLSDAERERLLALLDSEGHRKLSPRQLVPRLADKGLYLASESTMYRILRARAQRARRAAPAYQRGPVNPRSTPLLISAPNHAWSWDITYLKRPKRGSYFYLYLIMDVFSRRIMGWEIHEEENTVRAATFIRRTCQANGIHPRGLILHSDNGGPMKGIMTLSALRELGIIPSFSRPHVRDDNAFSEALFRTLKRPSSFPSSPFHSLNEARACMERFTTWYNLQHRHSALSFVTPDQRYHYQDHLILSRRRELYERARRLHPARWARHAREWAPPDTVPLNARLYIPG